MSTTTTPSMERHHLMPTLKMVFMRGLALFFLWFSLKYWIQLIGYTQAPNSQFDLMAEHWQVAVVSLAVLSPVVALGLWGLFSWGFAVWFVAIAIECIMYLGFPQLFGTNNALLLFHAFSLLLFSAFAFLGINSDNKV